MAKRVGNVKYLSHLDRLNYGNKKTGPEVTMFWLEGELTISAREQIEFFKKLYKEDLSYKKSHIQLLKNLMIVEKTLNIPSVQKLDGQCELIIHMAGTLVMLK